MCNVGRKMAAHLRQRERKNRLAITLPPDSAVTVSAGASFFTPWNMQRPRMPGDLQEMLEKCTFGNNAGDAPAGKDALRVVGVHAQDVTKTQ